MIAFKVVPLLRKKKTLCLRKVGSGADQNLSNGVFFKEASDAKLKQNDKIKRISSIHDSITSQSQQDYDDVKLKSGEVAVLLKKCDSPNAFDAKSVEKINESIEDEVKHLPPDSISVVDFVTPSSNRGFAFHENEQRLDFVQEDGPKNETETNEIINAQKCNRNVAFSDNNSQSKRKRLFSLQPVFEEEKKEHELNTVNIENSIEEEETCLSIDHRNVDAIDILVGARRKRLLSLQTEHEDDRKQFENVIQIEKVSDIMYDCNSYQIAPQDNFLFEHDNRKVYADIEFDQNQNQHRRPNHSSGSQISFKVQQTNEDAASFNEKVNEKRRKRLLSLHTSFECNPSESVTLSSCNCILTEIQRIGKGKFTSVYKGKLFGLNGMGSKIEVAIKQTSNCRSDTTFRNFLDELELLESLETHLNVVNMIGSCETGINEYNKRIWLFLEFCQHGDLKNYLIKNKSYIISKDDTNSLNYHSLIPWSFEIAKGMQFLAERNIIHGNLSASNILLHDNPLKQGRLVAKITDFGNTNAIPEHSIRRMIPWRWAAIEVLTQGYFSTYSDVWSFGVVFYEIISFGRIPYAELISDESVLQALEDGQRLSYPKTTTDTYSMTLKDVYNQISSNCFQTEPLKRATFSEISNILQNYLSTKEHEEYRDMCKSFSCECKELRRCFNRGWSLQSI